MQRSRCLVSRLISHLRLLQRAHASSTSGTSTEPRKRHALTRTVIVNNLLPNMVEDTLKEYFSRFGKVTGCLVYRDFAKKASKKFGFVEFETPEQVIKSRMVLKVIE